jgi:hypothetical protein
VEYNALASAVVVQYMGKFLVAADLIYPRPILIYTRRIFSNREIKDTKNAKHANSWVYN